VLFSILALGMREQEVRVIKVIRFGRALRPLRVVKRLAGLRLVVNSVVKALPHCFHVAMLSLMLFMLFGILGVNFFGGRFYSCTDPTRTCLPRLAGAACPAHLACVGNFTTAAGVVLDREWVNPSYAGVSEYSFDSSLSALLTLFEVANLELWHEVMWKAADVTGVGWAPVRDANQYSVFYFIAFVVMASFFMLNLFVSVVVDNFNRLKHAALASPFLTPAQRKWISMQERITRRRPRSMVVPPESAWRQRVFHVVVLPRFELFIMGLIMLNVLVMSLRYRQQPEWWAFVLDGCNVAFGGVFILEVIVKVVGLGAAQYWSSGWNRFDFSVVAINVATFVLSVAGADLGVDFTLLRVVRVVRLFRLVKTSRRLRTIFSTLYLSLPSLANVGALLLLLFFMYAIAGMSLFGTVPHGTFITEHANFEEFVPAMLLLLRMSTGESWNGIMHDCAGTVHKGIVFFFFTSFMLLGQFMMLNLFVAVILENFEREMEAEADSNEIKPDDLDAFAALWAKLVAKQAPGKNGKRDAAWLSAEKLAEILLSLSPPLGLHSHHRASRSRLMKAIRVLDIPINRDGKIHYSQTLRALVRRVCGEDLPTDMDEATQKTLPRSLRIIQPYLSNYSTSQLFAAKFVQLWVRSVYARRKAMGGNHHGELIVTVRQARHLKDLDAFGKQDPYVFAINRVHMVVVVVVVVVCCCLLFSSAGAGAGAGAGADVAWLFVFPLLLSGSLSLGALGVLGGAWGCLGVLGACPDTWCFGSSRSSTPTLCARPKARPAPRWVTATASRTRCTKAARTATGPAGPARTAPCTCDWTRRSSGWVRCGCGRKPGTTTWPPRTTSSAWPASPSSRRWPRARTR